MTVARNTEEWAAFLREHMPPGDALDMKEGSLFWINFQTLAASLARFDALLDTLVQELDPSTTAQFVGEWESEYDLPRDCQPPTELLSLRRAILFSLITRSPDISPKSLIEAAAVHGFTITIKEYFPETNPADLPLSNRFRYDVTVAGGWEIVYARASAAQAGDPLTKVTNTALECLLDELEPAYAYRQIIGFPSVFPMVLPATLA